jgi:hypothetical protein
MQAAVAAGQAACRLLAGWAVAAMAPIQQQYLQQEPQILAVAVAVGLAHLLLAETGQPEALASSLLNIAAQV